MYKTCTRILQMILLVSVLWICCLIPAEAGEEREEAVRLYQEYRQEFDGIWKKADIEKRGFRIIEDQVFPVILEELGEVTFIPALDRRYSRLAVFIADESGRIIYKTDQLETNNRNRGELRQPNKGIAAVSFQDVDGDMLTDIVLITSCANDTGDFAGRTYKVGDVLFRNDQGFYRDYRLSDKINRFSMNKSVDLITAFLRDGYSTEFLYTAVTLEELLDNGFQVIPEHNRTRWFEKLGTLETVPGTYRMADYDVFMIYLVDEQGNIVWSFQPMGDYDNLYALKGITCKDIDGDNLKDVVILARYSYEGQNGELVIESDYSIYYQRTAGFSEETDYENLHECREGDTVEELVEKARAYWGWSPVTETDGDKG